jgi:hypothetical protein
MKNALGYLFLMVFALVIDFVGSMLYTPDFKVGECAIWQVKVRKIVQVNKFYYNYCVMKDGKCGSKIYSIRVHSFDKMMKKTSCKENK